MTKLMKAYFEEKEITNQDRLNVMERWVKCVLEGKDKPQRAVTAGGAVADPELEKMRLQSEITIMQMEERLHREDELNRRYEDQKEEWKQQEVMTFQLEREMLEEEKRRYDEEREEKRNGLETS